MAVEVEDDIEVGVDVDSALDLRMARLELRMTPLLQRGFEV